jgi:hypothetical protein
MNEKPSSKLEDLRGKELAEASRTYAFGVLDVDVPEDLQELWAASFEDEKARREAEASLARLSDRDREILLTVAVRATAEDRPETEDLLTDSVEQAGQSMVVVEAAVLAMAGALLLREWHKKGRKTERRKKTVIEPGRITIEEQEIEYEPGGNLADALAKLGLGSGG